MQIDLIKVILPSAVAFLIGMTFAPALIGYLYRYKMWKKKVKTVSVNGIDTPIFNDTHDTKETSTPRMGGIVIWASAAVTMLLFWALGHIVGGVFSKLDFLSRGQTWVPLFVLLFGALVGLADDLLEIRGQQGGLSLRKRLLLVTIISFLISLWFYFKLGVATISVPFMGVWHCGILFIPIFILVTLLIYSGGVIDGIDGLSAGVFGSIFAAYAVIAFFQNQINLAAFCAVIIGSLIVFLWFNVPPAKFYMSETGSMALTITIAVVAFMTDSLSGGRGITVLPIIALPLLITTFSNVIQVASAKLRNGKRVFLIAPLHHHFEAKGWPGYTITMRYWIVSIICAVFGIILALIKI